MSREMHTPGPWKAEYNEDEPAHVVLMDTAIEHTGSYHSHHVWQCDHCLYPDEVEPVLMQQFEEAKANARLIAAAPELLAACNLAMQFWYSDQPNDTAESVAAKHAIRAAIAKATEPTP